MLSLPGMFRVCNGIARPALYACRAGAWHRHRCVVSGRASSTTATSEPSLPTPTLEKPEPEEETSGDKAEDIDKSTASSLGARKQTQTMTLDDLAPFNIHPPLIEATRRYLSRGKKPCELTKFESTTMPTILAGHDALVACTDKASQRYSYLLPALNKMLSRTTSVVEHPRLVKLLNRSRGLEILIICPDDKAVKSITPILFNMVEPFYPHARVARLLEYDRSMRWDKLALARLIKQKSILITTEYQLANCSRVKNILYDKMTCLETVVVDGVQAIHQGRIKNMFKYLPQPEIREQQRLLFTETKISPYTEALADVVLRKGYKILNQT